MKFIITFNVKEECLKAFEDIMRLTKQQLPTVDGCAGVDIYRECGAGQHFTLVESWTSNEAHDKHVETLTIAGIWDNILKLLSETELTFNSPYRNHLQFTLPP